jgi:CheY-like chemotaxis protein
MNAVLNGSLVVLLVEDNPADVLFFPEALDATRMRAEVHVVGDGGAAMRLLRRQPPFADAPRPDVIVLDMNLPVQRGDEVLAEMAGDPHLRMIPVAILSTVTSKTHVSDVYPSGRCECFVKTADFSRLQDIVRRIAGHAEANRAP